MALSDLYQLVHKQSQNGQSFQNVYFFEKTDPSAAANDLTAAFVADVLPAIQALQPQDCLHKELIATCLGNLGDNDDLPLTQVGSYGNVNSYPLFNAINFTMKPVTRAISAASKRYSPVPTEVATDDYVTSSGYVASLNALKAIMGEAIGTDPQFFNWIVVKRIKTAVPDTQPQQYTYRLPTIGDTPVYARFGAILFNTRISSQISRKA